jgi:uncharacterized protein with ATP-grasp and redox domains
MSYERVVLELVEGITDTPVRVDFIRTIYFIADSYRFGRIDDATLSRAVYEIVKDLVEYKFPFETPENKKELIEKYAKKLLTAIRTRGMALRLGASPTTSTIP